MNHQSLQRTKAPLQRSESNTRLIIKQVAKAFLEFIDIFFKRLNEVEEVLSASLYPAEKISACRQKCHVSILIYVSLSILF